MVLNAAKYNVGILGISWSTNIVSSSVAADCLFSAACSFLNAAIRANAFAASVVIINLF